MRKHQKLKTEKSGMEQVASRTVLIIVIALVAFISFIVWFSTVFGIASSYRRIEVKSLENVSYRVTRNDGSVEEYDEPYFPMLHKGEKLTVTIPPIYSTESFDNAAMIFSLYHCYVDVHCGDSLLYEQKEPKEGIQIGHRIYMIPLPSNSLRKSIVINAVVSENDTISNISTLQIVPDVRSVYVFQAGKTPLFVLMLTMLMISLFMLIISVIELIRDRSRAYLFGITLFCVSIVCWYMGYNNLFVPFIDYSQFIASVEYVGLFLAPAALAIFMTGQLNTKPWHQVSISFSIFFSVLFVIATVFTFSVNNINYSDFIRIDRPLFFISFLFYLIGMFRERKLHNTGADRLLRIGISVAMVLGVLELIRFYLGETLSYRFPILRFNIAAFAILALLITLILYFGLRPAEDSYARIEKQSLEKLAYVDQLTGAPNRSACYRHLDELRDEKIKDFVIVFVDINFLKMTNDTWGHDKGDELIRTASDLLRTYFTDNGFYGRWGGDEFIACHIGTIEETEELMKKVQSDIDRLNREGRFDFNMSMSWGFAESTKLVPITPEQAINDADEQMYTAKLAAHAAREQQEEKKAGAKPQPQS